MGRGADDFLRDIVAYSSNTFYVHDTQHRLLYLSPQVSQLLDCTPEEALVRWTEFATDHPANQLGVEATERAMATGERQPIYELQLVGARGRVVWVEVNEAPVVRDGTVVAVVGALADITARKHAQTELREREQRLRRERDFSAALLEAANAIVVVLDDRGHVTLFNPAAQAITGYRPDELGGKAWFEVLCPRERYPHVWKELDRQDGWPDTFESPILTKSGEERVVHWRSSVLRQDGRVAGAISFGLDVTERTRTLVTRKVVRRILRELSIGPQTIQQRREIGRAMATENTHRDVEGYLADFRSMGVGDLELESQKGDLYVVRGTGLIETTPGFGQPTCHIPLGYLEGAIGSLTGGGALGSEVACQSQGQPACRFVLAPRPLRPDAASPRAKP